MTRRPVHRAVAWLMAVLLALVVLEPMRVHDCPLHGQLALRQAAGAPAHAGHGAHGAPMSAADGAASHHGGQPAHDGPHPCDCLGACGLTTLVALTPPAAVHVVTATVAVTAAPLAAAPVVAAPAAEHVLPFANGPPARV
ncbi:MAG TPA: hypothetical protein VFS08_17075 [Gemmatimonadaceae bacterium]|nr:hypothetical protein [Gemmatimonadaceae bacterium]